MTGACLLCILHLRHCSGAGLRELREALMFRELIVSRRTWEEAISQCALCVIDTCKRQSRASGASQPRTLVGWGRRLQERLLSGGGQG